MSSARTTDIFLIHPATQKCAGLGASWGGAEHLGLEYVASQLAGSGGAVESFNIEENYRSPEGLASEFVHRNPLWIGLSPTSLSMDWTLRFCRAFKGKSNVPIVLGGHLATHMGADLLECAADVDIVVLGDGELTAVQLTAALNRGRGHLSVVPGIIYRDVSRLLQTAPTQVPDSLDQLKWPLRNPLWHSTERKRARLLTSRGCPYRCSFCTTPNFYGRRVRYRDMRDVVREMQYLYDAYGITEFAINDDIFFDGSPQSVTRIEDFVALISESVPREITFRPQCRADVLLRFPDLLIKLRSAGMECVFVGLESASEADLIKLRKDVHAQRNRALAHLLTRNDVTLIPGFIMFTGVSTFNSIRLNSRFISEIGQGYRTTPFCRTVMGLPGTAMFYEMRAKGDYDGERSSPFLLKPRFQDPRICELSVAMEEVEVEFSPIDRLMLDTRKGIFDKARRAAWADPTCVEQAELILRHIEELHSAHFERAVELAEKGHSADWIFHSYNSVRNQVADLSHAFREAASQSLSLSVDTHVECVT